MLSKRYSFIIAERSSGVTRRFTIAVRPAAALLVLALAIPIGWIGHEFVTADADIERLQLRAATLNFENARYRTTTRDLAGHIKAMQLAIGRLSERSVVDPRIRRAMGRISETAGDSSALLRSAALNSPTDTFDLLSDLLNTLESRLAVASAGIDRQHALAAATPINLPSAGRVTGRYGFRSDPFTGERTFHNAVDISTGYGQPVYATAGGRVASAGRNGDFGNLIKIDHGFGLATRYGHLSKFAVADGDLVSRGDVIGYAGATGRATGSHVHYEVSVDSRSMNPLQLMSPAARTQAAN